MLVSGRGPRIRVAHPCPLTLAMSATEFGPMHGAIASYLVASLFPAYTLSRSSAFSDSSFS